MSNMNMVPVFGTSFAIYIPIVMIVVAMMTLFNFNNYILRLLGVESDDSYSQPGGFSSTCCQTRTEVALNDEDLEKYEAGKKLVTSELRSMALSISNSANSSSKLTSQFNQKSKSINRNNLFPARDSDSSNLTKGDEKGESPYLDEETNDDLDDDSEEEIDFTTDGNGNGNGNGKHKKSSSIDYIKNSIHSSLPLNNDRYIKNNSHGGSVNSSANSSIKALKYDGRFNSTISTDTSTTGIGNNIISKFTDFFQTKKAKSFNQSIGTECVSRVCTSDERELSGSGFTNGKGFCSENKRVLSSSLLPLRDLRGNDVENGLQYSRDGERERGNRIGFVKEDSNSKSSDQNNFGRDEEPVAMYSGRRYANI